ncbi:hypothetical protein ACLIKD_05925 [Azonexus sp. IMCC34842]|uniref:hypothetical protein n=1 Tax=Azonexus sp. IMCC34842 TaxID=3420950 RepID=UPI003D14B3D8
MKRRLSIFSLLIAASTPTIAAPPACQFESVASGPQKIGRWIDKNNWLTTENLRRTLPAANIFMPALRLEPDQAGEVLRPASRQLDLAAAKATDPIDGRERDLEFLLDSRLAADGILILQNGRILAESYRHGLRREDPRLLLQATRPLLNLLGAISIGVGKLAADRPVNRYLPTLSKQPGIRKLSVQRLLENEESRSWSDQDLAGWRQAGGWTAEETGQGMRPWLSLAGRWEKPPTELSAPAVAGNPDDDLLAWLLAESNAMPLSRLFCEQLQTRLRPEHPVLWLTDSQGTELADGLALSLRDFARLGNLLLETRSNRNRSRIPSWFIETLTASAGLRTPEIRGLTKGSEARYGFVHLGGDSNRAALIGPHGNSLYIDFDRRLVVALYASYPAVTSPALLATLDQLWKTIGTSGLALRKP